MIWQESFWPNIGGAEVMATKLLLAMRRRGHEFVVVTRQDRTDQPAEDQYDGIPIYRFPFWTVLVSGRVDKIMEIRQWVARLKHSFAPELVHVNCFGPSVFFHTNTASAHPTPLLVTLHSQENLVARASARTFMRSADWIVGCSSAILELAHQLAPETISRSSIIYNGLEPPGLSPAPLPFAPPRLLCLGRVVAEKGFDLALSAFASLAPRFPGIRLTVAGDGLARAQLEAQALQLGILSQVDFLGWVVPDAVPSLLNTSTIVLMPSQQEAFPLVALEASVMARPVVASRIGGLREIVLHGKTGLLIDSGDCGALAQAVASLLDNPEMGAQMGQAARRRVLRLFSFERHVEAYETLYDEVAGTWRGRKDRREFR